MKAAIIGFVLMMVVLTAMFLLTGGLKQGGSIPTPQATPPSQSNDAFGTLKIN
jgi:hypothetical protein